MVLVWLAVALAFAVPFALGITVQDRLERRDVRHERLVPVFYLMVPLGSALLTALLLRANL
jgi:hypothetical protein